jgi:hypothetical protein
MQETRAFLKKPLFLNPRRVPSPIAIQQLILNSCALHASMYPVVGKTATKVDGERLVQNPTLSRNCDTF